MRVALADDAAVLREGLARVCSPRPASRSRRRSARADELLDAVERAATRTSRSSTSACRRPGHDEGLAAAEEIRRRFPQVGVLVLSQYVEAEYALRLLEGGSERLGYLLKDRVIDVDDLVDALQRVAAGESVVDPALVARLLDRPRERSPLESSPPASARCSP